MYTTEHPSLVDRASVLHERPFAVEFPAPAVPHDDTRLHTAAAPERPRDTKGHCWDGHSCDHPDHGPEGGPRHLMR